MGDDTLEERIAKHKVIVAILELALKKRPEYEIEAEKIRDYFSIKGTINNFRFEYAVYNNHPIVTVQKDQHVIEIYTSSNRPEHIETVTINGQSYQSFAAMKHEMQEAFKDLFEILVEKVDLHQEEPSELYEKLRKGDIPEVGKLDRDTQKLIDVVLFGHMLYKRVRKEVEEKVPEFLEIVEQYHLGAFHPPSQPPVHFTSTEEVIKDFDLS